MLFNIQKFCTDDGPGIRTTVFFKGCPLRCQWCANPESQRMAPQMLDGPAPTGRAYSVEEVLRECLKDRAFYEESGGGVTLSGGEPLMQPDFAASLLRSLQAEGVHTALETTGYGPPDAFSRVLPHTDLFLYDVKHHDSGRHHDGTGVPNALILENLRAATRAGKAVLARIPVIPGYNNTPANAAAFAALLCEAGVSRVQLLPFHQFGEKKYTLLGMPYALQGVPSLHREDLAGFAAILAESGLHCAW